MARIEIVCPNCGQINRRGTDFVGRLLDPRQPQLCTLCGARLRNGKRDAGGMALGAMGWAATYLLNALVGAGGGALLFVAILLAWPDFIAAHAEWRQAAGSLFLIAGVVAGLALAERARRKGELHTRARRANGRKR